MKYTGRCLLYTALTSRATCQSDLVDHVAELLHLGQVDAELHLVGRPALGPPKRVPNPQPDGLPTWGDDSHSANNKVPEAKIRGSQKGFQWVILGLERVPGVLKGVQRDPLGPLGPLELSALR